MGLSPIFRSPETIVTVMGMRFREQAGHMKWNDFLTSRKPLEMKAPYDEHFGVITIVGFLTTSTSDQHLLG